jgi:Pyridoxamine 5'-phosphate oxidase
LTPPPRTRQQRKQDSLRRLEHDVDAWVATADPAGGSPYLVPLSFLWDGRHLLVATPSASPTSRNLQATGRVRLAIGPTRDLVLIEGTVLQALAANQVPDQLGDAFAARTGSTRASWPAPTGTSGSSRGGCRPGARPTSWPGVSSCGMDAGWPPTECRVQPPRARAVGNRQAAGVARSVLSYRRWRSRSRLGWLVTRMPPCPGLPVG